jgi:S-DNA-T family DNA segregation ATPase FtsK/SpoIIIE
MSKETAASITDEDELPPIDLLAPATAQDTDLSDAQLDRLGASLLETLRTFKVEARLSGRTTGPVVTQFEVVPAPGVKASGSWRSPTILPWRCARRRSGSHRSGQGRRGCRGAEPEGAHGDAAGTARIAGVGRLARDAAAVLCRRHRGQADRGRPRQDAAPAHRRRHRHAASRLAINSLITSLVYRYTPRELRLLMVDPKMVELSMYNTLPHLGTKVVTHSHDAARCSSGRCSR